MYKQGLQYYVYISKNKVNMLHDQLPVRWTKKLKTSIKAKIPHIEASISKEHQSDDSLVQKLQKVIQVLEDQKQIGTLSQSTPYFHCKLPMRGTMIQHKLIFFGAEVHEGAKFSLGLSGSPENLIHSPFKKEHESSCGSFLEDILLVLEKHLSKENELPQDYYKIIPHVSHDTGNEIWTDLHTVDMMVQSVLRYSTNIYPTKSIDYMCVAKRLLSGNINDCTVVLGTPLYVAIS